MLSQILTENYGLSEDSLNEARQIKADKGGPAPETALNGLICSLAEIYEKAEGKKATISYDPYSEDVSGKIIDLIWETLEILGNPYKKHSAVAKQIKCLRKS